MSMDDNARPVALQADTVTPPPPGPLTSRIRSRVEWIDTDASGHYHHATVIKWVEAAEAQLFREVGLAWLYGNIPRVHYEANYLSRAWFGEEVDTDLTVDRIGHTSLRLSFRVTADDEREIACGTVVLANAPVAGGNGRSEPWPEPVRKALDGRRAE